MKFSSFFLALVVLTSIGSCSNDFDLVESKVEVPVVYAIMNQADTAQYFRVERAFVDPNVSGFVLAQRPDSLYYPNAQVSVSQIRNGNVIATYQFQEVDGETEGYPRQDGLFATVPNKLYKFRTSQMNLNTTDIYRLNVRIGEDKVITAETRALGNSNSSRPTMSSALDLIEGNVFRLSWSAGANAALYGVSFDIKISEVNTNGQVINKTLTWRPLTSTDKLANEIDGTQFYTFLAANLSTENISARFLNGIDYKITAVGQEFAQIATVAQANLGITSSGEVPTYTNLSEGRGIFTSRQVSQLLDRQLTPRALDSLRNGRITRALRFQ